MSIRWIFSVVLIAVVGVLSVPANLAAWQERQVANEDRFVATMMEAFKAPEVQDAIARRLTDVIMERAQIQDRVGTALETLDEELPNLPDGLFLLQAPLTNVAREAVYRASLRVIQSDSFETVLETALRLSHRTAMAVLDDDVEILQATDNKIVLDLGALLEAVVLELAPQRGQQFLDRIDLPEDAGQIVLLEKDEPPVLWLLIEYLQFSFPWVPILTLALLALAVIVAPDRRRAFVGAGAVVAAATFITLWLVAEPFQGLAVDSIAQGPEGEAAVRAAYDILVDSFKQQQVVVIFVSMSVAFAGLVAGDRDLVGALRGRPGSPGLSQWVRRRAATLRMLGFATGAFFFLAWPDASNRLLFTVLSLLLIYLALLWMATSDAAWAARARERMRSWRESLMAPDVQGGEDRSFAGRVARWAIPLRIAGIAAGVMAYVAWPSPGVGLMLAIVGLELLYLAAVDAVATRGRATQGGAG